MRIVRAAFLLTVYEARASRNSRSAIASSSSALSPDSDSGSIGKGELFENKRVKEDQSTNGT